MECDSVTAVLGITSMKVLAFLTAGQVVSDDSQAWSFRVSRVSVGECEFTSNHDRIMFTCTCIIINWDRIIGSYKGYEVYCRIIWIKD